MSAEPIAVGITSTTSIPTSRSREASSRHAQSKSALVIPPGSGVPVPGAKAGSSTSTSTVRNVGAVADDRDRLLDDRPDPALADVVHEEARDAVLRLPAELALARASSRAGRSARSRSGSTWPSRTSRYIGVPCESSTPNTSVARVRVRVEMDERDGAVDRCDRLDVGLGDRVVAAEDDRDRAGRDDLADDVARSRHAFAPGSAGTTGASPKSTTRSSAFASTLASRCGPGGQPAARIARGPKRVPGRSEARSSIGAPTIATSKPASSAGSCVYGRPANVSSPA